MMNSDILHVLALETSTPTAEVAVVRGARGTAPSAMQVLAAAESGADTHSEVLLTLIDEVLRAAALTLEEVDGIAIGAGPGSFTGLRIGMATAKGLAFAKDKPLWMVSSLAALAMAHHAFNQQDGRVIVPIVDARRREVFVGGYRMAGSEAENLAPEAVMAPGEVGDYIDALAERLGHESIVSLGSGFALYPELLAELGPRASVVADGRQTPSAAAVGYLALGNELPDRLSSGTPVYVRPSEAELKFPGGNPGGTFAPPRPNDA